MNERKEEKEVEEVKGENRNIAAFFDLDGTLLPGPSLEQRFFRAMRYQRAISKLNYLSWLTEAMRLAPRGINEVLQANKMYLRGAAANWAAKVRAKISFTFYLQGVEQVAWHASRGHGVFVVSGTLEPLAMQCASALEKELASRHLDAQIGVIATRLEEECGHWTGRVLGEAMFGPAKARALARASRENGFRLEDCYAYGDSELDRWMLASVGRPAAVNAQPGLAKIARMRGWPKLHWGEERSVTLRHRARREAEAMKKAEPTSNSVLGRTERCA